MLHGPRRCRDPSVPRRIRWHRAAAQRPAARWPRPAASRTPASNSGLNGVTTPFAATRRDGVDRRMPLCGATMISEEFDMNRIHLARALRAASLGLVLLGNTGIARADIKDYEFKLTEPTIAVGKDRIVTVQLVNKKTGKPGPDAV